MSSAPRPVICTHCGSPPRPFPGEPACPECHGQPVTCWWRFSCGKAPATQTVDGYPACESCAQELAKDDLDAANAAFVRNAAAPARLHECTWCHVDVALCSDVVSHRPLCLDCAEVA